MDEPWPDFTLVPGGPFDALERALRLEKSDKPNPVRQALALMGITWLPLMAMAFVDRARTGHFPATFSDWSIHARLLAAVPLFFVGEDSLHKRTRRCVRTFVAGGWADADPPAFRRALTICVRLRDARAPEAILLAIAIGLSQVLFWTGTFSGLVGSHPDRVRESATAIWYGMVALPVFQFLLGRWFWRWAIWTYLLWRMSRLRLVPIAAHPDRSGGLGFLAMPSMGMAWVLAGLSAVSAGAWASQVLYSGAPVLSFEGEFLLLLVTCVAVTLGPLLVFSPTLWAARLRGLRQHSLFSLGYVSRFEDKWLATREPQDPLGSPDIQSLADLQNSYQVVSEMRAWPFAPRHLIILAVAVAIPMIPLLLIEVPLLHLVKELTGVTFGGVAK